MPDFLFDFQKALVEWAVRKGRCAIFADCGLGKTPMQLVWAQNIVQKTNGRVLILTPLAVAHQTVNEAAKFGLDCQRIVDGHLPSSKICVTNYQQLHKLSPLDFTGLVCDESSILKSFDGATKLAVTEFAKKLPYRLLCTATAAPNDYIELGTSSEALGVLGHMDMLNRFFKNDQNNSKVGRHRGEVVKWRFKGHAELPFWRWVCSWARACRKPSDIGFNDARFILPPLNESEVIVQASRLASGQLFAMPAIGLYEQREERRRTIQERCESVAAISNGHPMIAWCHLNPEGDLLEELIPDSVQVSGADSDDAKEEKFIAFEKQQVKHLITKPKIGAWGLNFQHCAHMTMFPSHSFEQYYQSIRRCWRFGQTRPVHVDIITSEGERGVMLNLQRKARQSETMFESLVAQMNHALSIERPKTIKTKTQIPPWI